MIEVPARELAGRDPARDRIEESECTLEPRPTTVEDRVVYDFVPEDGEVEHREPLHDGERNPDQRVLEPDQRPRRNRQDGELPRRHRDVADRLLAVQLAHLVT